MKSLKQGDKDNLAIAFVCMITIGGLAFAYFGSKPAKTGKMYVNTEVLTFAPQLVNPTPEPEPSPTLEPSPSPTEDRRVRGPRKPAYPYRKEMDCVFLGLPFHKIETGARLYLKIRAGRFMNKCWAEPPNSPSEPPEIENWGSPMEATEQRQDEARCNAIWFGEEATRNAAESSACWVAYGERWGE
jgi:hypothetical protein